MKINGNCEIEFQTKQVAGLNRIGEKVIDWLTIAKTKGILDMTSGNSNYNVYNSKIEESTHVFLCDYMKLDFKAEDARAIINGEIYDVKYIDNPLGMNVQLEIYLSKVG